MEEKKFSFGEYEVTIGKYAKQADGAAWVKQGGTIILSTVVSAPAKEFPGFLPLTVDYRELFAAAGKIPGGYFKREGKFTDKEVLTARLIDRTIRPLFPYNFFDQVQVLSTVYSVDKENMPHGLAMLGTSIALITSKIPFLEPIAQAEIARVEGKWIINPKFSQSLQSDVRLIVGGTKDGICMIEGSTKGITEQEFVEVIFMAHEEIKKLVLWQEEIFRDLKIIKDPVKNEFNIEEWTSYAKDFITEDKVKLFFNADKIKRNEVHELLEKDFLKEHAEKVEKAEISETFLKYIFDQVWKDRLTDLSFSLNKRFDLRDFDTVRNVSCEVGLLPFTHGSGLFTRGRTQALVSATLSGGTDGFKVDELMDETIEGKFLLHYNFPPFSVGEVRSMRAPGRREIGHGYLAASAISQVLPNQENFPYLIRIVSDILESDGSSSMATVCGSTLSLLDAGVPISDMVSGIAMGFLAKDGDYRILTDILGNEDAFGLMDFKVAGTADKILAIQMDIKYKGGLKRELFVAALEKAKKGRLHILSEMKKVMDKPRAQLSPLVPRFVTLKVNKDKIGAIIGTGGKVIREIIEKTGTTIDIEDSGMVKIFGQPGEKLDFAVNWVKLLGGLIEIGSEYKGKIVRIADFGLIVELIPGVDGMVHISTIPKQDQEKVMRSKKLNEIVLVKIVDYDQETGRIRLKLV